MRKFLSLVLVLAMVMTMGFAASAEQMTDVGTPRNETLIVECQSPTDTPGQFNPYMSGTSMGFGIHQLMMGHLWEMDTIEGAQFPEIAAGMPESNEDFTEHIVKIREGLKWSDGEAVDAHDVAYTFNMIMENSAIGCSSYANTVFESVEAVDDYTVKFVTKESFPRLTLRFSPTIWGSDYRIIPEHIFSQEADVTTFKFENPVVCGPYTVKSYDPNGQWILYELREDWTESTLGLVGAEHYGYTAEQTPAKYVWFRCLGDDTTRQMMMVNNEVDLLCEVTPEQLTYMTSQNDKIACWYNEFPYATSDDPCSKGIVFSHGQGAPYDDANFRWGIALMLDLEEISLSIFDGAGRASVFPCLTNTTAFQNLYGKDLAAWLENDGFLLDTDGDGTGDYNPWDPTYAERMAVNCGIEGTEEELIDMFGVGCWKYDVETAEKLLNLAGLTKENGTWMYNGEVFKFNMSRLADTEAQAGRGVEAAYNMLLAQGFDVTFSQESSSTWDVNGGTGNFQISGYWPTGFITRDIYSQVSGWNADLITPVGETTSGQGSRWNSERATEIIKKLSLVSPDSEESYELGMEFAKVAIEEMPHITFMSGVKFVPSNSSIWEGYPTAANAYNGPWWWWSCFKYILPNITLVQG